MSQNAFQLGANPYNAVSEIWAKTLLKSLRVTGVYRHIAKDHSSELSANSDAIHLRLVDQDAVKVANYYTRGANAQTAGTEGTIAYSEPKVDKITLELTETPYAAVTFEDYVLKTADVKFQAEQIDSARYQLSRYIDTFVMNTIIEGADKTLAAVDATSMGEGEMYDLMLQIAAYLKEQGAMPTATASDLWGNNGLKELPYVVVSPAVERYLLKEPAFVKVDFTDKSAMWKDGIVRGTIAGLVVLVSSNMPTTDKKVTIFGGIKSATHFAIKKVSDRMLPAEDKFRMKWSTLFACGAIVSHPKALVKVDVTVEKA